MRKMTFPDCIVTDSGIDRVSLANAMSDWKVQSEVVWGIPIRRVK